MAAPSDGRADPYGSYLNGIRGRLSAYRLGKAQVLLGGVKAPVLGRICMDMCMVRIPEGVDVHRGDEVTVFGPEGWTAEDAADAAGTISYEVLCAISRRVPRFYR
ncbi:MAG: alanine racemase [Butyricicoccaceae bacterium]